MIKRLQVSDRDVSFDLELRGGIVLIGGDSGTGKSYLVNLVNDRIEEGAISDDEICVVHKDNEKGFRQCKNKLVIIDRADDILDQDDVDFINQDMYNQYLIMTRHRFEFFVSPNYIATLQHDSNNHFTLKYMSSLKGWV